MCGNGGVWSKLGGKLAAKIRLCGLDSPLPCLQMPKKWWRALERASAAEGKKAPSEFKLFTSDWSILGADKVLTFIPY